MAATDHSDLRRTPLFDVHRAAGARLVPFAGWEMPVQYTGILAEHRAVREHAGLFDVSHMGEFLVEGPGAEAYLQKMTSNDISRIEIGQAQYNVACLPSGGIVDDLLVYRRGEERFLVCVNAGRLDEDWAWFSENYSAADDCTLVDASDDYAQLAVQGPAAVGILQGMTAVDLASVATYRFTEGLLGGVECIIARTGYTGEDGFELFFSPRSAPQLWSAILAAGAPAGLVPVGLGARDTLRLEMKYCLYGNDITTETTPLEARLGWITKLDKGEFIGRDKLAQQKQDGVGRRLVGFKLCERGIPRHGYPVLVAGEVFGAVTSGAMSPSLGTGIGLCYLPSAHTSLGTAFEVEIRGRRVAAEVVRTPFYKKEQ
jgi:aminomethyltransferase